MAAMNMLAVRSRQEEQMDAADIDPRVYATVLADLARVNRWTFTARPTLNYLDRAAGKLKSFALLDVGFGHGDMLRAVGRWAQKRGITARLVGVDLNPMSEGIARAALPAGLDIDYRTGDYRDQPEAFDFIISSQVAHHMSDGQLGEFLRYMEANTAKGWLVADLNRHVFSHTGYPLLARLMGVHPIVRQDGTLSIARSIRPSEWPAILARAGLDPSQVNIARRFPFRVCVERIK
jgi:2-polyprenyl-3-methyl-5-hydroxy-6-metoxy-1,4-benzoquinol methylase